MKTKFFDLDSGYGDWQGCFLAKSESKLGFCKKFNSINVGDAYWDGTEPLQFMLMGSRTRDPNPEEMDQCGSKAAFEKAFPYGKRTVEPDHGKEFRDIINWATMSFVEYNFVSSPNSRHFRIVSPKMKRVLEQFHMIPHRFYPIILTHEVTKEKRDYFLFSWATDFIWEEKHSYFKYMAPIIFNRETDEKIEKIAHGKFNTYDNFIQYYRTCKKTKEEYKNASVVFNYYVFSEPYDIHAVGANTLLLSEQLKEALDANFDDKWTLGWEELVITDFKDGDVLPKDTRPIRCKSKPLEAPLDKKGYRLPEKCYGIKNITSSYYDDFPLNRDDKDERYLKIHFSFMHPELNEEVKYKTYAGWMVKDFNKKTVKLKNFEGFQVSVDDFIQQFPEGMIIEVPNHVPEKKK